MKGTLVIYHRRIDEKACEIVTLGEKNLHTEITLLGINEKEKKILLEGGVIDRITWEHILYNFQRVVILNIKLPITFFMQLWRAYRKDFVWFTKNSIVGEAIAELGLEIEGVRNPQYPTWRNVLDYYFKDSSNYSTILHAFDQI